MPQSQKIYRNKFEEPFNNHSVFKLYMILKMKFELTVLSNFTCKVWDVQLYTFAGLGFRHLRHATTKWGGMIATRQ